MRLPTRIVTSLLLAVSVVTCTDGPTGPAASRATLTLVPRFSDAAIASYNAVEAAGLVVDRARVILVRPPSDTLKDTTAMFAAGDSALALSLTVPVAPGTRLDARIELRSGNIVVYAGHDTVTAQIPNGPVGTPPVIPIAFVGPGATATRISFTPHGGTFTTAAPFTLSAQVFDASSTVLPGALVTWTSSDPTVATVSGAGVLTFTGKTGSSDVTATSPPSMVTDHALFTFTPPPPQATRLRFDVQPPATTPALESLAPALVVSLVDSTGTVVTSASNTVTLTLAGGTAGAALGGTRTTTAVNGRATFSDLSVDRAGTGYQLAATATGLASATSAAFTITQPLAATLSISPIGGTLTALGDLLSLSATVRDRNGGVLPTTVAWTSRSPGIATVDSTGAVRAVANGSAIIIASAGSVSDSVLVSVRQAVDSLFMSRDTVKLALNDTTTLVATALDRNHNVIRDAAAVFTSADPTVATVTSAGRVQLVKAGTTTITANAGGKTARTVVTQAAIPTATRLRFDVQPPASTPALEQMAPAIVVSLIDSSGTIITSATSSVTLTLGGGTTGATLAGTRTVSAANGRATFGGLSVDRPGVSYQFTATAAGLTSATSAAFTITQPVPASVSISPSGGTLTALGDLLALSATVRDRNGNVLSSVVPTWTSRAPSIASVDGTGSVRAAANGSAYVVAQAGSASDSVLVTVRQQVDTVFLSRDTLKLAFNDTTTIVATALDRNRNVISGAAFIFTSADATIATVTAGGRVQLVKSGTTTITATSGGKTARTVVMQGTASTGITAAFAYLRITPGGGSVRLGGTTALVAEYVDASGSATVVTPQWASSQPGRAPVSASGVMTANDTGTVQVTATRNGVTGHATFTILPAPTLTSFSFSPTTVSGASTNTVKLGVTFGAFDSGSGIASVSATFTGPNGATASCSAATPTSGSAARGSWDCTLALPAGSPTGAWRATSVVLAGSITRSYDTTQLASFGSTTLTVNP